MSNNSSDIRNIKPLGSIDVSLFALIIILTLFNSPYWNAHFMVGHDTKNTYLFFHYVYNHLMIYGELPQWLPFGEYGYSTLFYQICDLSPCSYLAGLLGWVLRIKDSLLLFKLATFGDQLLFLLGLHLLSRQLYRRRTTRFIICLLGIGCVVWTWQIYWSLRVFYLLPLALFCFYRFFVARLPWAFWGTLLLLLYSIVGGLPYWAPIYLVLFLTMTAVMVPEYWRAFGGLSRPGWRGWLLALVVAGSATALGYLLLNCLDGLHNYSPGRSQTGMYTDLKTFLTFNNPLWQYAHAFIDGIMSSGVTTKYPDDLNMYVGLLPVAALLLAVIHVRDRKFLSLVAGLAALVLLAGSGLSSVVLYWLIPGMKSFRHLGQLLALAKILLLLASGFGIDLLVARLKNRAWLEKHFRPVAYFALLAGLCLILDMVVAQMAYNPKAWTTPMQLAAMLPKGGAWIALRLAVWAAALTVLFVWARVAAFKKWYAPRFVTGLLVMVCLIDIGAFQAFQWQQRRQGPYAGQLELKPLRYLDVRDSRLSAEARLDYNIITASEDASYHAYYANIIQYDPCVPRGYIDIFPKGVHELVTARGARPVQDKFWGTFLPYHDQMLQDVLGCDAPKVRFVTKAHYGRTDAELNGLISAGKDLETSVILRESGPRQTGAGAYDVSAISYHPTFFNANRLDLDVSVKPGFSGWLVFADAYDPHWKAYINGHKTPVLEAYRAFKAIALAGGDARVSFRYENTLQKYAAGLLAMGGILLAMGGIIGLVWLLFNNSKEYSGSRYTISHRKKNK